MSYAKDVLSELERRYACQPEFLQAATELLSSVEKIVEDKVYSKNAILERLVEPDRIISFKVPWIDDSGTARVNRGFRVQFNNSIGVYKGGLRFHPSVNESIVKFLGFEQVFKNSLTGLPIGGAKGGSDFDPKGKSDKEVFSFVQSFMAELHKYIGADIDVPAGDIGVGAREIGYMFGAYKKLTGKYEGVFTGKGTSYGGSLVRKEATGYGLVYLTEEMLKDNGHSLLGKRVLISGSGNVAIYAAQKAIELGAIVVTMSDSNGFIYAPKGIKIDVVKRIKEANRGRIKEYLDYDGCEYVEGESVWQIKGDIALPCATQNELDINDAKALVRNGVIAVGEGANMPTSLEACHYLIDNKVLFAPAKAANAGGVAVSALEMSQNSIRTSWSFEQVDEKLKGIMKSIYKQITSAAKMYTKNQSLSDGANIAGFLRVSQAMLESGIY